MESKPLRAVVGTPMFTSFASVAVDALKEYLEAEQVNKDVCCASLP